MTVIYLVCAGILLVAGLLAVIRAERGPSMLNRTVALDVFATVLVGGIALEAAWSRRLDTLPILVVLSMVGFVSSTAIARFASVEPESERRIRTVDEVAAEDARRLAEEEAADELERRAIGGGTTVRHDDVTGTVVETDDDEVPGAGEADLSSGEVDLESGQAIAEPDAGAIEPEERS